MTPACPHWLNLSPLCPCGHTISFEKFKVFRIKKCGRLSWTASNEINFYPTMVKATIAHV